MSRKRNEMVRGTLDNITEACPQMRHRFAGWATEEIDVWLYMHVMAHDRAVKRLVEILNDHHDKVYDAQLAYHRAALATISNLMLSVSQKWDTKDWWAAVEAMEDAARKVKAEVVPQCGKPPF